MPTDSCAIAWPRQHEAPSIKANPSPIDKDVKKIYSPHDDELECGSSEIQSQSPSGRAHAGEVSRRSDRQTNALPPPDPSKSGGRQSNTNSGRRRRGAAAPGEGFNNDSDSDDDEKNGNHRDGGDEVIIRRRQQLAQPAESHYEEQEGVTNETSSDEEREIMAYQSMQEMLKHLEIKMAKFIPITDQIVQQNELLRIMPAAERPGAIRSDIYDGMLEYVDIFDRRLFNVSVAAFRRHSATSSTTKPSTSQPNDELRPYFEKTLRSGQVRYEYVEAERPPLCAWMLRSLLNPMLLESPTLFRVLVKDNRPMHAAPIDSTLLHYIGYRRTSHSGYKGSPSTHWWRYQRGNTKFTRNIVFRVRMTGEVDGVWTSAEEDCGLNVFMEERRNRYQATARRGSIPGSFGYSIDSADLFDSEN
ncbi:hypothetical protein BDV19DRAFT_375268 [Aspergillus venezuelensis]